MNQSLVVAIVSVAGGGTIVPLLYSIYQRRTPAARLELAKRDEERSTKAAADAVDAVRDVLRELRTERLEDRSRIKERDGTINELRARLVSLEHRPLGEQERLLEQERTIALLRARIAELDPSGGGATTADA